MIATQAHQAGAQEAELARRTKKAQEAEAQDMMRRVHAQRCVPAWVL